MLAGLIGNRNGQQVHIAYLHAFTSSLCSCPYYSCICYLYFFQSDSYSLVLLVFDVTGQQCDGSKTRINLAHSAALARLHQVARVAAVPLPRYCYRYVRAHEE